LAAGHLPCAVCVLAFHVESSSYAQLNFSAELFAQNAMPFNTYRYEFNRFNIKTKKRTAMKIALQFQAV
jgi:hypothetical protein